MTHPIDSVYVDATQPAKADIRTYFRDHTPLRFEDEAAAAAVNLTGQKSLVIAGLVWDLDAADNSSAAVAGEIIVSLDGKRFKPTSSLLGPSDPPASASATGVTGTITWDSSFIYICVATNTWRRAAHATW